MKVNKDGTVHWEKGTVVEVSLHTDDHDPNQYYAQCQSSGTFPLIQVLDPKYPEPLQGAMQNSPYSIWRELSEAETKALFGTEDDVSAGTYVVNPQPGGHTRVIDKRSNEVVESFQTCDEACEWIAGHECAECGLPLTELSKECTKSHFGGEEMPAFTAF